MTDNDNTGQQGPPDDRGPPETPPGFETRASAADNAAAVNLQLGKETKELTPTEARNIADAVEWLVEDRDWLVKQLRHAANRAERGGQ